MNENPYQPGSAPATGVAPEKRAANWLVRCGVIMLGLAGLCLLAVVVGMMRAFEVVANSPTPAKPSELANEISTASIPSLVAALLALFGIFLIVLGFVRRQPGAKW